MLHNFIAPTAIGETILAWIEVAALGIEILAVLLIIIGCVESTLRFVFARFLPQEGMDRFKMYRIRLARSLQVGLEVLIAADIIRTVALEATLNSVIVLGMLVVIRTLLSWSLVVEIEERWPWQAKHEVE